MPVSLKRAIRVCAAVGGWLVFEIGLLYLLFLAPSIPYAYMFGADFAELVFSVAFLASNILIPILLIYYRHRRRDRWIQEEADRWLANRLAETTRQTNI